MRSLFACGLLLVLAGAGCETEKPLSATQWQAIETREVDGQQEDVLRAVAAVVLDKGYYYAAADKEAGLLTAAYVPQQNAEIYCRTGGMTGPVFVDALGIWVRPVENGRCEVRLQRRLMGHRIADEQAVTQFWAAVQRRMLGGEAAPPPGASAAASKSPSPSAPPKDPGPPVADDLRITGPGPEVRP